MMNRDQHDNRRALAPLVLYRYARLGATSLSRVPNPKSPLALPDNLHRDLDDSAWRCGANYSERGRREGVIWHPEVSVIEQIEPLQASLKPHSLVQRETLEKRGIHILDARRTNNIPR